MTHAEGMPKEGSHGLGLTWSLALLACLFVVGGLMHFVRPNLYQSIVPPWLPNAPLLVAVSGICEIMGGVGVLLPATRRAAGWGLIVLLVAVFPANVQMLRLGYLNHSSELWKAALWFRLPLQILLLWWTWRAAARPKR
jgi:uncharacterized membrane protein